MSAATDLLLFQIRVEKLPGAETEWHFHPERGWRFDIAFPAGWLAVEVDGGGFVSGRHGQGKGIEDDCEKYAEALCLGWQILRVTPTQIKHGWAIRWLITLLAARLAETRRTAAVRTRPALRPKLPKPRNLRVRSPQAERLH